MKFVHIVILSCYNKLHDCWDNLTDCVFENEEDARKYCDERNEKLKSTPTVTFIRDVNEPKEDGDREIDISNTDNASFTYITRKLF